MTIKITKMLINMLRKKTITIKKEGNNIKEVEIKILLNKN